MTGTDRNRRTASSAVVLAVLQAITTISGAVSANSLPITRDTRAISSLSLFRPIRKGGVIGGIGKN